MKPVGIILANGSEEKWGFHRDTRRHFIEIDGERLIDRTIRQFAPHMRLVVSGPSMRYKLPAAALYVPFAEPDNLDADILLSTRMLWNAEGRTIVILGDTWFSNAAAQAVVEHEPHEWTFFGREQGSRYSGTDYGELFALSFWPENIAEGAAAMEEINRRQREDGLWRGGLWEQYRLMNGIDPLVHEIRGRFVEINDETDDFDFADQFETWLGSRVPA